MRKSILAISIKLGPMLNRAENLSNSENESTADRYADILDLLQTALDALQEAADILSV